VAIKMFFVAGRPLETRFFVRHDDGEYSGYTYAFRDDLSDADLVERTTTRRAGGLDWILPGRSECTQCHTRAAGGTLGLEFRQLDIINEQVGVDQLEALQRLEMLPRRGAPHDDGVLLGPDANGSEEQHVRGYLHVNCGYCHRPRGPGRGALDLRFGTPLGDTGLCDTETFGALGTADGKLVAPGRRDESVSYLRLTRRDSDGMPPLASRRVDESGAERVGRWIDALDECSE
jgi:mono/diheme cytochrome c family protein